MVRQLVEAAEEVDGLQILAPAVLVGYPLSGLARVVEIEHGGDRVHAQAVDVILLQPEQSVRNQEGPHLVAAVVEDERAPLALLALARIGVLVGGAAAEIA